MCRGLLAVHTGDGLFNVMGQEAQFKVDNLPFNCEDLPDTRPVRPGIQEGPAHYGAPLKSSVSFVEAAG